MKKLFAMITTLSIVLSFAVVPAHAATFSSDNWVQYERGFKVNTSDFSQNFSEYTDTSYDDEQLTGVRMVGTSTKTLSANKTPVQYYWNSDSFEAGTPDATYAHFRVYLATFSDEYRNAFDYFEMRAISSSGGESNTFMFDVWKIDGTNYDADVYAKSYNNSTAYVTKDWGPLDHQGKVGTDFGNAANNSSNTLSYPSDYDKIDLIMEYNKQSGTTFYLFANGKFMGSWYESTITTKHFNGVSFRVLKDRKIRGNSDYIAVKFDPSRIGHREYYNTSGYYVTLEDVLQDAGLGNTINNDKIMYQTKSGDLQWFMPGNEQTAYHYPNKLINGSTASARVRIGENITYSGTEATITATNTESSYAMAARMLAGFYPINGKCGIAYESYHPRAKYVRLSFDQTISNSSMWLEYQTYYSGGVTALQMWDNEENLVVSIKRGSGADSALNVTCNGNGGKPTAYTTGTNHIDWILEPVDDTNVKQYIYINGVYLGEGYFGNNYAVRINDIILNTSKAAGTVKIDNWQMTVYNENADYDDIDYEISGELGTATRWISSGITLGEGANENKFSLYGKARTGAAGITENAKIFAALYNGNKLLDFDVIDYLSNSKLDTKYFKKNYDGIEPKFAKLFLWRDLIPLTKVRIIPISKDTTIRVLAIGNSFSQDSVSKLKEIAAADGISIESYNAYLAGRNLKGHYDAWNSNGEKTYRIEPEGVNSGEYQSLQDFVTMEDWDYIMLQGTTHFSEYDAGLWNVNPTNTSNYWTTLKNGIAELAPDAKRLVNATWAPINELSARVNDGMFASGMPDSRGAYLTALLPNEQIGANIYSTETRADGGKEYIPVAVAIDYLIRHYRFPEYIGDLDGSTDDKYDNSSSTRAVYRDKTCHLTDNVGRVLAGLVWYEMITGIPATQSSYQRNTLTESDMTRLKDAAHYACQNYTTYNPAAISSIETDSVYASAVRVKNNADAIITIIHDDGSSSTAQYLNREFAKHNLVGTVGIIGTNINTDSKVSTWTNVLNSSNGRLNFASHTYNHRYMGETDNAESGALSDGTEYNYPAGHMSQDIANERSRINGLFPNERVLTFIKPGTSYPDGKKQVSDAAMEMIQSHYIAMRNTGGGVDTIPPEDYYSVKSLMAKPDQTAQYWINNLSSAYSKKGMLVYLFHGIVDSDTASGNNVKQSDVSTFLIDLDKYYVSNGRVWNAKFDEAIQYMREFEAVTNVEAVNHYNGEYITVAVSDNISKIDTDITSGKFAGRDMYDYPLTIKTEIPYDWEYVKLTQSYDSRVEVLKVFTEGGKNYVYANVVPDQAAARLSEATSNDYLSSISYGGTSIEDFDPATFYYKVTLAEGTVSAPTLTCNKGSAVITQATLSDGEGSGFITFAGLKYEIHFSVE